MSKINELKELIKNDAVKFGNFILSSGKESDLYVDLRKVTLSPKGAFLIGSIIFDMIKNRPIDAVGGMSLGADPIAVATSLIAYQSGHEIKAFLVRKGKKDHGTKNMIEGPIAQGFRVVVVEDVITTGASTITAIRNIEDAGMVVDMVIGVFDRSEGGSEAIKKLGYEVHSILERKDI
jgi:orotate phosphoribosyltransferase